MASGIKVIRDVAIKANALTAASEGVSSELVTCTQRLPKLVDDYMAYLERMASPASKHVNSIIEMTNSTDWEEFSKNACIRKLENQMLTGHEEAQVLRMLVSMSRATRVLEIGMFTGCAALAMAEALPSNGRVVTCEINPTLEGIVRKLFDESPHGEKITIKIGPAMDTLEELLREGQQFDFVFIDADKSNYANYFKFLLDKNLLAPGGTICADNTLWQGNSYLRPEERDLTMNEVHVMPEFNDVVYNDDRVYQVILPVRDGLSLIRRKRDVDERND